MNIRFTVIGLASLLTVFALPAVAAPPAHPEPVAIGEAKAELIAQKLCRHK